MPFLGPGPKARKLTMCLLSLEMPFHAPSETLSTLSMSFMCPSQSHYALFNPKQTNNSDTCPFSSNLNAIVIAKSSRPSPYCISLDYLYICTILNPEWCPFSPMCAFLPFTCALFSSTQYALFIPPCALFYVARPPKPLPPHPPDLQTPL